MRVVNLSLIEFEEIIYYLLLKWEILFQMKKRLLKLLMI